MYHTKNVYNRDYSYLMNRRHEHVNLQGNYYYRGPHDRFDYCTYAHSFHHNQSRPPAQPEILKVWCNM